MTSFKRKTAITSALLMASALLAMPVAAHAQDAGTQSVTPRPTGSEEISGIVPSTGQSPNLPAPGGILDNAVNITGVGQFAYRPSQASTGLSVCTASLINPRTVILAAHCVNTLPTNAYGTDIAGGAVATSVGFEFDNRPAIRQWLGLASVPGGTDANPALRNATNLARNFFAVEQVAWHPGSVTNPAALGFIESDIAIATLDTPAWDIPTWTLLFSPLEGPTHGVITGYGATGSTGTSGANLGIDFRRRAAENMIDFLGSLDQRNAWLFGGSFTSLPQALYQLDFDSPAGQAAYNPAAGRFDFDLFDGAALPREATTAGGDSGGPLIADQAFSKPVVVGVLSGGSRFFGPQPFSSFGTSSFYQPLFLYWDWIVQNNPYKYVSNLAGDADWTDASHWIQTMDPNYAVARNGELVNALPGNLGLGKSTSASTFGKVCFLSDCLDITQTGSEDAGTGAGLVIAGGPGSTNFVPNNVRARPLAGISARYYDVTLSAPGTTRATTTIEIDRLSIDGPTKLNVQGTGNLTVLGDFTQYFGWTNVDGRLKTGEALVASGILSGSGTFDPTFLTVANAFVAPGGDNKVGTLTIQGDLILSSKTTLFFDASRNGADKIAVVGDAQNTGIASLGGTLYFQKSGPAPRHGQTFDVLTATGGVQQTFDQVLGKQGVLRPTVSYGANTVSVTLFAGKLTDELLSKGTIESAFAATLDSLRSTSYTNLNGLYGAIDVMDPARLTMTLRGLNPTIIGESASLGRVQTEAMNGLVSSRLSRLGTASTGGGQLEIVGSPGALLELASSQVVNPVAIAQRSLVRGMTPASSFAAALPEQMSGFISGNVERSQVANADAAISGQSERSNWNFAMGLETQMSDRFTLGTAAGFANGTANLAGSTTDIRTSQAAVYGTYRLNQRAYVAGLASLASSRIGTQRSISNGELSSRLNGDASALAYTAQVEAGINLPIARGLTLTPKAALRYSAFSMDRLREAGGELALRLSDIQESRLEARLGLALDGTYKALGGWSFSPQVSAQYVGRMAGNGGTMTARFDLADAVAFNLPFGSQDGSWGEVKAGMRFVNGPVSIGAGVETSVGRYDFRDDRAVADFTIRF